MTTVSTDAAIPGMDLASGYSASVLPGLRLPGADSPAQIDKTAKDFESVFIGEMLQPMFDGISVSGWGQDEGAAGDTYRSWLVEQYGKLIAAHGGIGLAGPISKEILALQEVKKWVHNPTR